MKKYVLDKEFGLYKAANVLSKVFYIVGLCVIGVTALVLLILGSYYLSVGGDGYYAAGVTMLPLGVYLALNETAIAVIGAITRNKIKGIDTKPELIPWAVLTIIFINDIAGVFYLCSKQKEAGTADPEIAESK